MTEINSEISISSDNKNLESTNLNTFLSSKPQRISQRKRRLTRVAREAFERQKAAECSHSLNHSLKKKPRKIFSSKTEKKVVSFFSEIVKEDNFIKQDTSIQKSSKLGNEAPIKFVKPNVKNGFRLFPQASRRKSVPKKFNSLLSTHEVRKKTFLYFSFNKTRNKHKYLNKLCEKKTNLFSKVQNHMKNQIPCLPSHINNASCIVSTNSMNTISSHLQTSSDSVSKIFQNTESNGTKNTEYDEENFPTTSKILKNKPNILCESLNFIVQDDHNSEHNHNIKNFTGSKKSEIDLTISNQNNLDHKPKNFKLTTKRKKTCDSEKEENMCKDFNFHSLNNMLKKKKQTLFKRFSKKHLNQSKSCSTNKQNEKTNSFSSIGPILRVRKKGEKFITCSEINNCGSEAELLDRKRLFRTLDRRYDTLSLGTSSHTYVLSNSVLWLCSFCQHGTNYECLGDLFGPYYPDSFDPLISFNDYKNEHGQHFKKKIKDTAYSEFWVHEDCAVWTAGIFMANSKLCGLQEAINVAKTSFCTKCKSSGATIGCFFKGCCLRFHYLCALEMGCLMDEDNLSLFCPAHKNKKFKTLGRTFSI